MTRLRNVSCEYCRQPAELVTGKEIYPHRPDLHDLKYWRCTPCDAYVGCHRSRAAGGHGDGTQPMGRLANARLRAAKSMAHDRFDCLWRGDAKLMSRTQAYVWLAKELSIPQSACHIGMFDEVRCMQVVEACERKQRCATSSSS